MEKLKLLALLHFFLNIVMYHEMTYHLAEQVLMVQYIDMYKGYITLLLKLLLFKKVKKSAYVILRTSIHILIIKKHSRQLILHQNSYLINFRLHWRLNEFIYKYCVKGGVLILRINRPAPLMRYSQCIAISVRDVEHVSLTLERHDTDSLLIVSLTV